MCQSNWFSHPCRHTTFRGTLPCREFFVSGVLCVRRAAPEDNTGLVGQRMTDRVINVAEPCEGCRRFTAENRGMNSTDVEFQRGVQENMARSAIIRPVNGAYNAYRLEQDRLTEASGIPRTAGGDQSGPSVSVNTTTLMGRGAATSFGGATLPTPPTGIPTDRNPGSTPHPALVSHGNPTLMGPPPRPLMGPLPRPLGGTPPRPVNHTWRRVPYPMRDHPWMLNEEAALYGLRGPQYFPGRAPPPLNPRNLATQFQQREAVHGVSTNLQAPHATPQIGRPAIVNPSLHPLLPPFSVRNPMAPPPPRTAARPAANADDPFATLAAHREHVRMNLLGGRPLRFEGDGLDGPS